MKSIPDEFANVLTTNKIISGGLYFSNRHKDTREWHMLGAAKNAFSKSNHHFPDFAEKKEGPDFALYDAVGTFQHGLEATMVLPPERRLHQEHRDWEKQGGGIRPHIPPNYKEHWEWLRKGIREKLAEKYINGCDLLVYFDINLHDTNEELPNDFCESIRREWARISTKDFGLENAVASRVRQILILSADMKSLVTVYPGFQIISR